MTKIIIAGNRDFDDPVFNDIVSFMIPPYDEFTYEDVEIISGGCSGADAMAEAYAKDYGITLKVFPADWNKYGKSAGPIRNEQMAKYATTDSDSCMLIAFWDGKSRGTKNMIDTALKYKLDVHVFMWERKEDVEEI